MCKCGQIAAIFAEKYLSPIRDVLVARAFGSAVKRHDNDVRLFLGGEHEFAGSDQIVDVRHAVIVAKTDDGDTFAFDLEDRCRIGCGVAAGVFDTLFFEHLSRACTTNFAKITRVIIRDAHHIKSRFLEVFAVTGRDAKRKTLRRTGTALARCAGVNHRAFEIAKRDIRRS